MKIAFVARLSAVLLLFSPLAQAQVLVAPAQPGYWNAETNLTSRDHTFVLFYNGQDQLVYEETLPNICLDFRRRPGRCRRAKTHLDAALQLVLRDPAAASQNPALAARQLIPDRRAPHAYAVR